MTALAVALLAGAAAALAPPAGLARPPSVAVEPRDEVGWMRRWRGLLSLLAGIGIALFLGGAAGAAIAVVAGAACWVVIGRAEPLAARREREQVARELPHLVRLLSGALAAGAAAPQALEVVAEAAPGAAGARLAGVAARLRLGADPAEVWADLARAPALGPLGRALARAHATGAPVAGAIARLSEELARDGRSAVENRARAVGVKAAVPLGVCLLPCFLLIGVVPLAAGLLTSLQW